jgi:putative ABC transport system ATP-binding protein
MTIIQVTHNEEFATYGSRIIRLVDGLIRSDKANKPNMKEKSFQS